MGFVQDHVGGGVVINAAVDQRKPWGGEKEKQGWSVTSLIIDGDGGLEIRIKGSYQNSFAPYRAIGKITADDSSCRRKWWKICRKKKQIH